MRRGVDWKILNILIIRIIEQNYNDEVFIRIFLMVIRGNEGDGYGASSNIKRGREYPS